MRIVRQIFQGLLGVALAVIGLMIIAGTAPQDAPGALGSNQVTSLTVVGMLLGATVVILGVIALLGIRHIGEK